MNLIRCEYRRNSQHSIPYAPCMKYLPTSFGLNFHGKCIGKYSSPMEHLVLCLGKKLGCFGLIRISFGSFRCSFWGWRGWWLKLKIWKVRKFWGWKDPKVARRVRQIPMCFGHKNTYPSLRLNSKSTCQEATPKGNDLVFQAAIFRRTVKLQRV